MPATFEVMPSGNIKVHFSWEGKLIDEVYQGIPPEVATRYVNDSALYNHRQGKGPTIPDPENPGVETQKPWDDLTNQEKLDMVQQAATRTIKAQADTALYDTNLGVAREDTAEYIDEEYGDFE